MANPFLVLGGVAVGVITAGIGVLAVPGWIDSAHDSAAMNDLGNIRGAESAAILQLGEYTDDFGVLRSGELGVKFQKSDTVTLVGLKADSNESWCASVLSKSGKYFAASSDTARFATGRGAEGAMLQVGCDPDLIEAIITAPIDGVDVGDPASEAPGEWVGGGSNGGGANGPGTPGGTPGGGGFESLTCTAGPGRTWTPAPATAATHALGPVVESTGSRPIWTPQGVYMFDGRDLVFSPGDMNQHLVTPTGAIGRSSFTNIQADCAGNLYLTADTGGEYSLFKMTPDWSTTALVSVPGDDGDVTFAVSASGAIGYMQNGGLFKVTGRDTSEKIADAPNDDEMTTSVVLTDSGTFHFTEPAWNGSDWVTVLHTANPDGAVSSWTITSPASGDATVTTWKLFVGGDNTVYLTGDDYLATVGNGGALNLIETPDAYPGLYGFSLASVGSDGSIFMSGYNTIVKLNLTDKSMTDWMPRYHIW